MAIKIDSPGPVIFKQRRTGYLGNEFNLFKFRTMVADNDVMNFSKGDKITKVGKFLRSTSLDELPQLLNIIINDMSFIGPRPWITAYWPYYTDEQKKRFEVKPGITGYAQAVGRKGLTILERIDLDLEYVKKISFLFDLNIIIKTILIMFNNKVNNYDNYTIYDEFSELIENNNKEIKRKAKIL